MQKLRIVIRLYITGRGKTQRQLCMPNETQGFPQLYPLPLHQNHCYCYEKQKGNQEGEAVTGKS